MNRRHFLFTTVCAYLGTLFSVKPASQIRLWYTLTDRAKDTYDVAVYDQDMKELIKYRNTGHDLKWVEKKGDVVYWEITFHSDGQKFICNDMKFFDPGQGFVPVSDYLKTTPRDGMI